MDIYNNTVRCPRQALTVDYTCSYMFDGTCPPMQALLGMQILPGHLPPRLLADLDYQPSAHRLSTTRLYRKFYKGDAEFRICSKNESEVLYTFEEDRCRIRSN